MNKTPIRLSLLRGVCQIPAYIAHAKGMFADEGLESSVEISATAWLIPEQLLSGASDFAVIPWTRVAAAEAGEAPLKVLCGSGHEEAAIVVRKGMEIEDVRTIAVPREGGMKDLTAMGLIESLGWKDCRQLRFPSGDGAIISFFGLGAEAASMVEPYATMMEELGSGQVVRRTGDIWPGAPGCSLAAAASYIDANSEVTQRVVDAYVRAVDFVHRHPDEASEVAEPFIGVHAKIIRSALACNPPQVDAVRNTGSMDRILSLMQRLGYVDSIPENFADLSFLDRAQGLTRDDGRGSER